MQHSYDDKYGFKYTKTRNVRVVPTHSGIVSAMHILDYGPETFIFSLDNPNKPVNKHFAELHLSRAIEILELTDKNKN